MRHSELLSIAFAMLAMLLFTSTTPGCTDTPAEVTDEDASTDTTAEPDSTADTAQLADVYTDADADSPEDPPHPLCGFSWADVASRVFTDPNAGASASEGSRFEMQGTVLATEAGEVRVSGLFRSGDFEEDRLVTVRFQPPVGHASVRPDLGSEVMIRQDVASAPLGEGGVEFLQVFNDDLVFVQGGSLFELNGEGEPVLPTPIFDPSQIRVAGPTCSVPYVRGDPQGAVHCWVDYTPMEVALRTEPALWANDGEAQVVHWHDRDYHVLVASYHFRFSETCPDHRVASDDTGVERPFESERHIGLAVLIE